MNPLTDQEFADMQSWYYTAKQRDSGPTYEDQIKMNNALLEVRLCESQFIDEICGLQTKLSDKLQQIQAQPDKFTDVTVLEERILQDQRDQLTFLKQQIARTTNNIRILEKNTAQQIAEQTRHQLVIQDSTQQLSKIFVKNQQSLSISDKISSDCHELDTQIRNIHQKITEATFQVEQLHKRLVQSSLQLHETHQKQQQLTHELCSKQQGLNELRKRKRFVIINSQQQ